MASIIEGYGDMVVMENLDNCKLATFGFCNKTNRTINQSF
ncbi:DUF907 domain protein [Aspergillus luchuensis]|uniref:DUF907 domain protein n=1 Tax=Aspergillus kawachii TaxID=1069201 RepID=A0A146FED3_ASPKA|nr:DUF907 domain protein [Aspergillus luchuensis]